jgi:hypothetical protein
MTPPLGRRRVGRRVAQTQGPESPHEPVRPDVVEPGPGAAVPRPRRAVLVLLGRVGEQDDIAVCRVRLHGEHRLPAGRHRALASKEADPFERSVVGERSDVPSCVSPRLVAHLLGRAVILVQEGWGVERRRAAT